MARFVEREWLDARGAPCFARSRRHGRRDEGLRCGSAEHEIVAVAAGAYFVVAQLASHDERDRDGATPGVGLDLDRSGVLVPSAFDTDHPSIELDIEPTQCR